MISLCLASTFSNATAPTALSFECKAGYNFDQATQLNNRALQYYCHATTNKIRKVTLDDPNSTVAYFQ